MTRNEFDKYKFLMKRSEIIAAGIPRKAILVLTKDGRLTFTILVRMKYFHKTSVAKLLGF